MGAVYNGMYKDYDFFWYFFRLLHYVHHWETSKPETLNINPNYTLNLNPEPC